MAGFEPPLIMVWQARGRGREGRGREHGWGCGLGRGRAAEGRQGGCRSEQLAAPCMLSVRGLLLCVKKEREKREEKKKKEKKRGKNMEKFSNMKISEK
jgi:hypothetical protein